MIQGGAAVRGMENKSMFGKSGFIVFFLPDYIYHLVMTNIAMENPL